MSVLGLVFVAVVAICGVNGDPPKRIVRGDVARISSYPYSASLRELGEHVCGAAIVGPRHVVTTAHCLLNYLDDYNVLAVYTGTENSHSGYPIRVANLQPHPMYDLFNPLFDIGVVTLAEEMTFGRLRQPLKLPDFDPVVGMTADLTGWGSTNEAIDYPSRSLKRLEIAVVPTEMCYPNNSPVTDLVFCGLNQTGSGACWGDSGDPLAYKDYLIGIASSTIPCNYFGAPDVYVNVHKFVDFITDITNTCEN